jgi:hypothetical protein
MKLVALVVGVIVAVALAAQDKALETNPRGSTPSPSTGPQIVVSFAVASSNGSVYPSIPDWTANWIRKNAKKYPSILFHKGDLVQGAKNYLVVFSTSERDLTGFDAVVKTTTSSTATPVSGTGTITSNYGYTWNYTFQGVAETTTTTTTQENVPYTIRSKTLYATTYDEHGATVSQRNHSYATKQGGDPWNSAGYNLGNALRSINARGRLIDAVLKDITR